MPAHTFSRLINGNKWFIINYKISFISVGSIVYLFTIHGTIMISQYSYVIFKVVIR